MRVLIAGENHRSEIRGRTVVIQGLAAALRERGHDVTLLQAAKPPHRVRIEGVRTLYESVTRKSLYPLLYLRHRLRGFDVIHANDEAGAYLALRGRIRALPLVLQLHPPHVRTEPFWRARWRWRYIQIGIRNAPQLLTASRWLADALAERFGIDPERFHVVPCGIGSHWFRTWPERRSEGRLRIALVNMKGVDVALRAFARADLEAGATLELYGSGKTEQSDRLLARELAIEGRVEFCGFVPNDELPSRLAGSDLLIHPARSESFGQVLAEAAALGIPSLASRVNSIPEVVQDGETGLLCPVDDVAAFAAGLSTLAAQPERRREMGTLSRKRALARWRWDRVASALEEGIYTEARQRRRGGAKGVAGV